jgi:hypothetical protein
MYEMPKLLVKDAFFQVTYYDKSAKIMVTTKMTRRELLTLLGDFGYRQLISVVAVMEAEPENYEM